MGEIRNGKLLIRRDATDGAQTHDELVKESKRWRMLYWGKKIRLEPLDQLLATGWYRDKIQHAMI